MRERDIEAHLVKRVKALGGEVRKVQWVGRVGAPDRLVMLPTRIIRRLAGDRVVLARRPAFAVWAELKAPGEKARPSQVREHQRMRAMGQWVLVIDSIEGVEELLA